MNTPSIALAVIAAALAGIGFAYVEHLVRSGFGLLLAAGTPATSRIPILRDEEGCYEMRDV